jgi:glycosyl transferase family 25
MLEFVIISLPQSVDRRKLIAESMTGLAWSWRFFDAPTDGQFELAHDVQRALDRRGYKLLHAERACFESHFQCIRDHAKAASTAPEHMIVLEDDVLVDRYFDFAAVSKMMSELNIDYLKLFSRSLKRSKVLGRAIGHRSLYRFIVPPYGSQAYVLSKQGAMRIVDSISSIDRPIDDEIDRYWINGLPTYALYPYPVMELQLQSTVPKGFLNASPTSLRQKLISSAFAWADKIPREWANLRLTARDRVIAERLRRAAGGTTA